MANIVVTVARLQACEQHRIETYDEVETEVMQDHTLEGSSFLPVLFLIGLPVTAVSALVTKIVVMHHGETKTRKTRALGAIRSTCATGLANVEVEVTLPSGAVVARTTDAEGRASVAIADTEPEAGAAVARVADRTQPIGFYKTTAGCEQVRAATFASIVKATVVDQRLQGLRALPTACGDVHARAWSLTAAAAVVAARSQCESVERIGSQVRMMDLELYGTAFVAEPDIAACLDGSTVARLRHADCVAHRSAVMLEAQQTDIDERTKILTSLPNCDAPIVH